MHVFHKWLFLSLIFCSIARASGPIGEPEPALKSNAVRQPHVIAQLLAEYPQVSPGQTVSVALHLHMDPGWHTYWINSGDAGLPTQVTWTLPPGFTASPLQWPVPEQHDMGGLVTFGYVGDTYLLSTITAPAGLLPKNLIFKAHATWLVCENECIPGQADLVLNLTGSAAAPTTTYADTTFFLEAKKRLPRVNDPSANGWRISGAYAQDHLLIHLTKAEPPPTDLTNAHLFFYPEQPNVLDPEKQPVITQNSPTDWTVTFPFIANGEQPDHLSGVLVSDRFPPVYFGSFPVSSSASTATSSSAAPTPGLDFATFLFALGGAFLGGLILNLMPCVLPVLALKVFSLVHHADDPRQAWKQGLAFAAGVVLSFWLLAGLLLILRATGQQLGWGFQMQSPGFILALVYIFFFLALNLFGVFEFGASLVGLDARVTGRARGIWASFGQGGLATLAATPCTAPFMGSALGFAAQQPPALALLIFTFLALGMAAPYVLFTFFPGALCWVPRPGAWMEAVRQFLGFPLLATVIWLVYVFGVLTSPDSIYGLLGALLLTGVALWVWGRWNRLDASRFSRWIAGASAFFLLLLALGWTLSLLRPPAKTASVWQPYSPAAVQAELAQGHPVFVDFTAAWCLSCKVNEHFALEPAAVQHAFTQKQVTLFRGDWTSGQPEITKILQKYHRDGVPLYLLYRPGSPDQPEILPELLTPDLVLSSLQTL